MQGVTDEYPKWGTEDALRMGIAHPDWPWHTPESRAEYEHPTGRWWVSHYGDNVPSVSETLAIP